MVKINKAVETDSGIPLTGAFVRYNIDDCDTDVKANIIKIKPKTFYSLDAMNNGKNPIILVSPDGSQIPNEYTFVINTEDRVQLEINVDAFMLVNYQGIYGEESLETFNK